MVLTTCLCHSGRVRTLGQSIAKHLADGRKGEILRNGVQVAILGPPNAGKSSLLNILARRPAAIVSSIAGTTRDIVQVPLNIAGYPVLVSDTAGLRETEDAIEQEGVLRAQKCATESDVRIVMVDIQVQIALWFPSRAEFLLTICLMRQSAALLHSEEYQEYIRNDAIVVLNKSDQTSLEGAAKIVNSFDATQRDQIQVISCSNGGGVDALVDKLAAVVKRKYVLQHVYRTHLRNH